MTPGRGLARRFAESIEGDASAPAAGARVLVALSGGLDSVVLLHLLRFGPDVRTFDLHAAHFDHAMRVESARDADWVRGLATGWGLPLRTGRADEPLTSEDDARIARHAFVSGVAREIEADRWVTAHHADDQAETVLFRIARGGGIAGLQGIPRHRKDGGWRPLLGFRRAELLQYAQHVGLVWREDPTNRTGPFARRALRHGILPALQAEVAPGVVGSLLDLAEQARVEEGAWDSLLPTIVGALDPTLDGTTVSVDAGRTAALHPGVRARVLRHLASLVGGALGKTGTLSATRFSVEGRSGSALEPGGGLRFARELDRLVLSNTSGEIAGPVDAPLVISNSAEGQGTARIGGRTWQIRWAPAGPGVPGTRVTPTSFPITVRGRVPGDRIRLLAGEKKVKKVLLEARVPSGERDGIPLVVDGAGAVLWIRGIASAVQNEGAGSAPTLQIEIDDAHTD